MPSIIIRIATEGISFGRISSTVKDTCRIYARAHGSCSDTLLRHFMLFFPPLISSPICAVYPSSPEGKCKRSTEMLKKERKFSVSTFFFMNILYGRSPCIALHKYIHSHTFTSTSRHPYGTHIVRIKCRRSISAGISRFLCQADDMK